MAVPDFMAVPPITAYHLSDEGAVPNNRLPLIVYHAAIEPQRADADRFEWLFDSNGWPAAWRNGILPFHHYHSTSHEALGIATGSARIIFGGPSGQEVDISAGDALVVPAGVGHKLIEASADLLVIGAYPKGCEWDLIRAEPSARPKADENIARVPMPDRDPVAGRGGPLLELWASAPSQHAGDEAPGTAVRQHR